VFYKCTYIIYVPLRTTYLCECTFIRPGGSLVAVGDGGVDALVGVVGRLEDEAEGAVLGVDERLDALPVGNELLGPK
jgi:hypothetical protein